MSWNALSPELRAVAERELSPRQLEVLKLKLSDYGYDRIATALDLSPSTVRSHWRRVEQKLAPHLRPNH